MSKPEEPNVAWVVFATSSILGECAAAMAGYERWIEFSLDAVKAQEVDPDNAARPLLIKLLNAADEFIKAHKAIIAMADMGQKGATRVEGSETIQ